MDPHVKHGGGGAAAATAGGGGGSIFLSSWVDNMMVMVVDRIATLNAYASRRRAASSSCIVPRADCRRPRDRRTDGVHSKSPSV